MNLNIVTPSPSVNAFNLFGEESEKEKNIETQSSSSFSSIPSRTTSNTSIPYRTNYEPSSCRTHHYFFSVRKSDSMFEKVISRQKTAVEIFLDVHTNTITFTTRHTTSNTLPETYSCAHVYADSISRGSSVTLKIYTASKTVEVCVIKKITFEKENEKNLFLNVLQKTRRSCIASQQFENVKELPVNSPGNTVTTSMNTPHVNLVEQEKMIMQIAEVIQLILLQGQEEPVPGILFITNQRIAFRPYETKWAFGTFNVPKAAVEVVDVTSNGRIVLLKTKDFRSDITMDFQDARLLKSGGTIESLSEEEESGNDTDLVLSETQFQNITQCMQPPVSFKALFCLQTKTPSALVPDECNGWKIYCPRQEYERCGFLQQKDAEWRLVQNTNYALCPSYPKTFLVPAHISQNQLVESASFRSKSRLPVAVWQHPEYHSVLARSSQPRTGMGGHKNEADQTLLQVFRNATQRNSDSGIPVPFYIIDCRKPMATQGNKLKGKGKI